MKKNRLSTCIAIALMSGSALAHATPVNLLNNGDMDGYGGVQYIPGWTRGGVLGYVSLVMAINGNYAESGGSYLSVWPSVGYQWFSQSFSDIPGSVLSINGWVLDDPTYWKSPLNGFNMAINGVAGALTLSNTNGHWDEYAFTAIATGYDTFSFGFQANTLGGFDNFSVTQSAVSEPTSLGLLSTGLLGLGAARRRRSVAAM